MKAIANLMKEMRQWLLKEHGLLQGQSPNSFLPIITNNLTKALVNLINITMILNIVEPLLIWGEVS